MLCHCETPVGGRALGERGAQNRAWSYRQGGVEKVIFPPESECLRFGRHFFFFFNFVRAVTPLLSLYERVVSRGNVHPVVSKPSINKGTQVVVSWHRCN